MTDLDDLIKNRHGDVKKLREIRDTIRHDNFITADAKKYIESLISVHLKNQPLDKILPPQQTDTKIQLQSKPNANILDSNDLLSNFSSNKKLGILVGVAAAIAIIVIVGFTATDFTSNSILSKSILVNVDKTTYQRADIISITGDTISNSKSVKLSTPIISPSYLLPPNDVTVITLAFSTTWKFVITYPSGLTTTPDPELLTF